MKRPIIVGGDVACVTLTRGCTAVIDAADVDLVEGYNWSATPSPHTFYAQRVARVGVNQRRTIMMHRVILGLTDPSVHVDHIDGNGLNNMRSNLRPCSCLQNTWNTGAPITNTSGYKGVSWNIQSKKWQAHIRIFGRKKNLGLYHTPEEAFAAYCDASHKYRGDFSRVA